MICLVAFLIAGSEVANVSVEMLLVGSVLIDYCIHFKRYMSSGGSPIDPSFKVRLYAPSQSSEDAVP